MAYALPHEQWFVAEFSDVKKEDLKDIWKWGIMCTQLFLGKLRTLYVVMVTEPAHVD